MPDTMPASGESARLINRLRDVERQLAQERQRTAHGRVEALERQLAHERQRAAAAERRAEAAEQQARALLRVTWR